MFGQVWFRTVRRQNNRLDGQAIFSGKFIVALVVTWNSHHGACAVFHQYEVGGPDRDRFASQRVNGFKAGINPFFLHRCHIGFCHFRVAALVDEGSQFRIVFCRFLRQRVTCGHGQVGRAHEGVRTGGVDGQGLVVVLNVEGNFHAFRTADPVALHGLNGIWPVVQIIQIVQQLISVSGDFNKPLRDLFTLYFSITAPAAAIDNLFVRENGLVIRAPVNGRGLLVHQAFFVQLGEEFLFPAVIFRGTGCQLAAPVIAKAQHFELVFHVRDVVVRPRCRRRIVFDRRAFRRQTERIPTDGLQNVFAQHALVARNHITDGVVTHVAHV